MKHESKIANLLGESPTAYYWVGFIMADGSISQKNRLQICLATKDKRHVEGFKAFIESKAPISKTKRYNTYQISIMDVVVMSELVEKFDIDHAKTYRPPSIDRMPTDDNLFCSLLIGFIDGDGCIARQTGRQDCGMIIKCHKNWANVLQYFSNRLCEMVELKPNTVHINKCGYAELRFTNSIILKFLKEKVQTLFLPVLARKWDLINTNFISRVEKAGHNVESVKKLLTEGKRNKEMSEILHLSPAAITAIMKRNNLYRKGAKL